MPQGDLHERNTSRARSCRRQSHAEGLRCTARGLSTTAHLTGQRHPAPPELYTEQRGL